MVGFYFTGRDNLSILREGGRRRVEIKTEVMSEEGLRSCLMMWKRGWGAL